MESNTPRAMLHLEKSVYSNSIDQIDFIPTVKDLINKNSGKFFLHRVLHLAHFSNVSARIVKKGDTQEWLELVVDMLKTSNFHTGYLLKQRAEYYKEKSAFYLIEDGKVRSISYNLLWLQVKNTARALFALKNDDIPLVVGIITHNKFLGVLIDLACLSFGIRVVPIPKNSTPENISYIINHSDINNLFIGDRESAQKWMEIKHQHEIQTIALDLNQNKLMDITNWDQFLRNGDNLEKFDSDAIMNEVSIQDIQTIMYTSGTTANPKGIVFNNLHIISKRFARALALPQVSSEDTFLCYLPLFHTFGRYFELMGSIFWGATYTFAESPAFNSLLNDFKLVNPSIFISIPKRWAQLHNMVQAIIDLDSDNKEKIRYEIEKLTGGRLKLGLSAAGYLDPDIFSFFHENNINLLSGYGMTEATGGITMTPPNDYRPDSVGIALPGIKLKIEHDGELCIKGPYVADGYYKEKNNLFNNGWFHTEDIFKENDSHYYIIDRKKDIYKNSRGQTVSPQKIENLFQDFDTIKSVFLVGDGKEFNTVLLYPNYDALSNYNTSSDPDKLREVFSSMILSVNSFLAPYERIINYVIINRDFTKGNGELTQKGSFVRKIILENFKDLIEPLYRKSYLSLYNDNKELRVPTWLLRQIGTIEDHLKWDGVNLTVKHERRSLSLKWSKDRLIIGNYRYRIQLEILDLDRFIQFPALWIGNSEFAGFVGKTIFRLKEPKAYDDIEIISEYEIDNESYKLRELKVDTDLYKIHKSLMLYLSNDLDFYNELVSIVDNKIGNWSMILVEAFMNFNNHPLPHFRIKLLEAITPLISGDLFIKLLHNAYIYLREVDPSRGFSFNIKRASDEHYESIIGYIQESKRNIDEKRSAEQEFLKSLLLLTSDFGIIHPTKFLWARSELINWQIGDLPRPLFSTAQKAYYSLIKGFRLWIGQSSKISVDPETGKEYGWNDVITFEDSVRQDHKERLLIAVTETSLLRESIFLFSKNYLVELSDIPMNGIYISNIDSHDKKSSFRVLVKTRNFGNHNLVLKLNEGWDSDFMDAEVKLLIKMGSGLNDQPLVGNFGGYWPEHNLYSESYNRGESLDKYLRRNENDIRDKSKVDRWQMRWLHFIWSGLQAYQEFWFRTNYEFAIYPPSPANLIIPQHDYKTGTRIISLSGRKVVDSLAEHFISLYTKYIVDTEKKFPGLNHMSDWEVIFTATVQALRVKNGRIILENLKHSINSPPSKKRCQSVGLTIERIEKFLSDIDKFGVLTKPVVFASLRYQRWLDLNKDATAQAKAAILQDLYKDYELDKLLGDYPETRLRFFMMTCFKDCKPELSKEFQKMIKEMREKILNPWNMQRRISEIESALELDKEEKYFLARMLFPHVDSADYVELVTTNYGQESKINLVYQTECDDKRLYRIRPPFLPKEIAQFHGILKESMLSVTFTAEHEFLFAFNARNRIVGGLYWKKVNGVIHLEWVAIKRKYQKISLSKRLMADFNKRMKASGFGIITVGFYAQNFFKKHGFKIEKQYGGMVRKL